MPKFNDFDLSGENWKNIDLNMDSLWVIPERKKWGKHDNFYHGNFIPQIPEHFIKRYTKKGWWVFDGFLWSATTAVECEELERNFIWVDIQESLVDRAKNLINSESIKKEFICGNSASVQTRNIIEWYLKAYGQNGFDLAFLHPPYDNIIKFTDRKEDLSNCETTQEFYKEFGKVLENTYYLLNKWAYLIVVIWDKYQNSEWIPLGFWCMAEAQKVWFKLKSIIVKNRKSWKWRNLEIQSFK